MIIFLFSFLPSVVVFRLAFASLVGDPVGITISAVQLKICSLTAGIKKQKKKKIIKKMYDNIVLLAKVKYYQRFGLVYQTWRVCFSE